MIATTRFGIHRSPFASALVLVIMVVMGIAVDFITVATTTGDNSA